MSAMERQAAASSCPSLVLNWIDRAIASYLLLPVLLFCLWLQPAASLACLGLASFGAWWVLRVQGRTGTGITGGWWFAIILVSLVWTALAGAGHFFYANQDWLIRDAVLRDLSIAEWPVTYHPDGRELVLRAPIAYYLPAAAIGHWLGTEAANWALYAWTAMGYALVLAGASSLFSTNRQRAASIALLLLFGGLDLLGYAWGERHLPPLGEHIEWWMGYIQYSSNSTLFFWVPNHALPAWLGTIVLLRHWRKPELAVLAPLLAAAIPLWSPLAAIGLFPLFAFALHWRRDARLLFSPKTCLPFFPAAAAIAFYLTADATTVPHGWMIENAASTSEFAFRYALFCLLEFGFLSLILVRLGAGGVPFWVSIAILLALPFYYYGGGNDLAMRASIPALTVLMLTCVPHLAKRTSDIWHALLALVLLIGILGSLQEPARSLLYPAWKPLQNSIPQAVAMWDPRIKDRYPAHYFARSNEGPIHLLLGDAKPVEPSEPAPGR